MSQTPSEGAAAPVQVCIVTGLSGAGKSTALRVFEDLRYFTVDGLPAGLAVEMVEMMRRGSMERFRGMALGMDMRQQDFLEELNVPAYKIASYEINDIPLIRKVAKLHKPVIFATGIAYPEDIERALSVCKEEGNEDVILLKCVSSYPTPYEAVNLRVIPTLQKTYDCLTGISDHTMGTIVSAGAVPLGAKMVEKHLTLKRSDGGPDSAFSMEPAEFKQMVDEIRILEKALGSSEYVLTDTQKLEHGGSRSLFVVKDIAAGEALTSENIRSIRPGCGLHTMYYEEVLGRKAKHFLKKGTPLAWDLID